MNKVGLGSSKESSSSSGDLEKGQNPPSIFSKTKKSSARERQAVFYSQRTFKGVKSMVNPSSARLLNQNLSLESYISRENSPPQITLNITAPEESKTARPGPAINQFVSTIKE